MKYTGAGDNRQDRQLPSRRANSRRLLGTAAFEARGSDDWALPQSRCKWLTLQAATAKSWETNIHEAFKQCFLLWIAA